MQNTLFTPRLVLSFTVLGLLLVACYWRIKELQFSEFSDEKDERIDKTMGKQQKHIQISHEGSPRISPKIDLEIPFSCPSYESLEKIPGSCSPETPKYFSVYNSQIQPLFQLPMGRIGPMAQLHGFRDFILASIQTRKFLGITSFRKHFGDRDSEESVPFGLRIDTSELCKLVDLKPTKSNLNLLIIMTHPNKKRFLYNHTWESHLSSETPGFKQHSDLNRTLHEAGIITSSTKFGFSRAVFKIFPETVEESIQYLLRHYHSLFDKPRLIGVYGTRLYEEGSTSMVIEESGIWGPGGLDRIVANRMAPQFSRKHSGNKLRTDSDLIREIYKYTPKPEFIRDIARSFIEKNLNAKFIGIHWRYNPGDFFGQAALNGDVSADDINIRNLGNKMSLNLKAVILNPEYFLEKLVDYLDRQFNKHDIKLENHEKVIFLASPKNMISKFDQVLEKFTKNGKYKSWKIVTSTKSTEFLQTLKNKSNCDILKRFYGDILPMVEMQILEKSFAFYRSRPSNWSFNVQAARFANAVLKKDGSVELPLDRVVLDIFVEEEYQMSWNETRNVNRRRVQVVEVPEKYSQIN